MTYEQLLQIQAARFAKLTALGFDKWQIRNDPVYQAIIFAVFAAAIR